MKEVDRSLRFFLQVLGFRGRLHKSRCQKRVSQREAAGYGDFKIVLLAIDNVLAHDGLENLGFRGGFKVVYIDCQRKVFEARDYRVSEWCGFLYGFVIWAIGFEGAEMGLGGCRQVSA